MNDKYKAAYNAEESNPYRQNGENETTSKTTSNTTSTIIH